MTINSRVFKFRFLGEKICDFATFSSRDIYYQKDWWIIRDELV